MRQVTPSYFDTARTPLLNGRVFSERDAAGAQPVVIVKRDHRECVTGLARILWASTGEFRAI